MMNTVWEVTSVARNVAAVGFNESFIDEDPPPTQRGELSLSCP